MPRSNASPSISGSFIAQFALLAALSVSACVSPSDIDAAQDDSSESPITSANGPDLSAEAGGCNGLVANCSRTYDQVAIAATHNAFAYASGGPVKYVLPNQDRPIAEQLAAGFRGLGLRPCPYFGSDASQKDRVHVTHNSDLRGALGTEPLDGILDTIKSFLDANPREIVSLYMESTVTPAALESTFDAAGLGPYLFAPGAGQAAWPTLNAMIASGRRLVVFNDSEEASRPAWMLYLYDHIVDTSFNVWVSSGFSCDFNRGQAKNAIYYLNHFVALPLASNARTVNDADFVLARAHRCFAETGRRATVVYVDRFREGNVVGAINALNREYAGL